MAIDILSRLGSSPIVVGDEEDIKKVRGLVKNSEGEACLLFYSEDREEEIRLSRRAEENMLASLDFIVVALTGADEIAWAFECRMGDILNLEEGSRVRGGRRLNQAELKELAEDLVAGDFNLDFIRGPNDMKQEQGDQKEEGNQRSDTVEPSDSSPMGPTPG